MPDLSTADALEAMAGVIDDLGRCVETFRPDDLADPVEELLTASLGVANRGRLIAAMLREEMDAA